MLTPLSWAARLHTQIKDLVRIFRAISHNFFVFLHGVWVWHAVLNGLYAIFFILTVGYATERKYVFKGKKLTVRIILCCQNFLKKYTDPSQYITDFGVCYVFFEDIWRLHVFFFSLKKARREMSFASNSFLIHIKVLGYTCVSVG